MTWYYKGREVDELPEDCVGYVYIITNLIDGRQYIGKKLSRFSKTSTKTITLKDGSKKKKKIKSKAESDWKTYYGSSEHLNADVAKYGEKCFKREIIHYCPNKGTLNYLELREQIDRRVMESDNFYNGFVGTKVHKKHIKLS